MPEDKVPCVENFATMRWKIVRFTFFPHIFCWGKWSWYHWI